MKQLKIRIYPNGEIEAETKGMKGKTCLSYISQIENMVDAKTHDSKFTNEYYEVEEKEILVNEQEVQA